MSDASHEALCAKIARLIEERGWNQKDFARLAGLDRLTVRNIFQGQPRRLHNATVAACARALDLTVHDLYNLSLSNLLERLNVFGRKKEPIEDGLPVPPPPGQRLYEEATQPELLAWAAENPGRAAQLSPQEWDELLSLQGTGGPLTGEGVAHFVDVIERRRRLMDKIATLAGTEYLEFLEQIVDLLYEKIQPYRNRS